VTAKVVGYGRRDLTIQRRRGKIYVNDRVFDNLPEVYRRAVPKIVNHFEKTNLEGKRGLESWATKLEGKPRTFACEGVMLELENGDEYAVPFFFFSDDDLKVLQPGWERWLAAAKVQDQSADERNRQEFLVKSAAQAYQNDRAANQQIAMMQLELLGAASGAIGLWEVYLAPQPGTKSGPLSVVVPGRDSRAASQEALRRYPGFVVGPVSKVSHRY
jgi:hypothetical protein